MIAAFEPGPWYVKQCPTAQAKVYEFGLGVNLLVGGNGCGKSTLLYAMRKSIRQKEWGELTMGRDVASETYPLVRFDFENENPRVMTAEKAMLNGTYSMSSLMQRMNSQFMSHGQSQRRIFEGLLEIPDTSIVFLDEPEQGMDHHGLLDCVATLKAMKARQVIISTHSPYLIFDPAFRVLELTPGYTDSLRDCLRGLVG